MIETARSASPDERLNFMLGTAERLPADEGAYDRLITAAGLRDPQWHPCYAIIIQSVTAAK